MRMDAWKRHGDDLGDPGRFPFDLGFYNDKHQELQKVSWKLWLRLLSMEPRWLGQELDKEGPGRPVCLCHL